MSVDMKVPNLGALAPVAAPNWREELQNALDKTAISINESGNDSAQSWGPLEAKAMLPVTSLEMSIGESGVFAYVGGPVTYPRNTTSMSDYDTKKGVFGETPAPEVVSCRWHGVSCGDAFYDRPLFPKCPIQEANAVSQIVAAQEFALQKAQVLNIKRTRREWPYCANGGEVSISWPSEFMYSSRLIVGEWFCTCQHEQPDQPGITKAEALRYFRAGCRLSKSTELDLSKTNWKVSYQ